MSVTKEFAVKIDTELAELHDQIWSIDSKIKMLREDVKGVQHSRYMNDEEKNAYYKVVNGKIDQLLIQRAPISERIIELNMIFHRDPWTRAFLVINSNGHVHSSMECSTCFDTTRYNWLVQYSNDDEATIVADAGQDACTVCYPSAPAEVLNRPSRIVTADKIAKAQAKAEREAKRQEKIAKAKASAPTASGEPLAIPSRYRDHKFEYIKTERSAVSEFNNNFYWVENEVITTHYYDGTPHSQESIDHQIAQNNLKKEICVIIATSLAEKHGVSFDEMWNKLVKKARKAVA